MKTFIFCTSYIDELTKHNNHTRYKKWIDFYRDKISLFENDNLFLIDDGSPKIEIDNVDIYNVNNLPDFFESKVNVIHFDNNLGRPVHFDYQGWWRSFTYSIILAEKYGYEKIIHIESDFFLVSSRLIDFIKSLKYGWVGFYSHYHQFPESAIQIICKDQFEALKRCYLEVVKNNFRMEIIAERYFPFTLIEKSFLGDRLGQFDVLDGWLKFVQTPIKLDYIGQVLPESTCKDYEDFFEFELKW